MVERGKIHSARAMKQNTQTWRAASKRMCFLELIVCQELVRQDNWPHCKELRQVLLDIRAGNSNLAKSLSEKK